jgi:hypothetical protein
MIFAAAIYLTVAPALALPADEEPPTSQGKGVQGQTVPEKSNRQLGWSFGCANVSGPVIFHPSPDSKRASVGVMYQAYDCFVSIPIEDGRPPSRGSSIQNKGSGGIPPSPLGEGIPSGPFFECNNISGPTIVDPTGHPAIQYKADYCTVIVSAEEEATSASASNAR